MVVRWISVVLLLGVGTAGCNGQDDLSRFTSHEQLDAYLRNVAEQDAERWYNGILGLSTDDGEELGFTYYGAPVQTLSWNAERSEATFQLVERDGAAKQALEGLEKTHGTGLYSTMWYPTFDWSTDDMDIKWVGREQVHGLDLSQLPDSLPVNVIMTFKPQYDCAVTQVYREVEQPEYRPAYYLDIRSDNAAYDVVLNGVTVFLNRDDYREHTVNLNTYILDDPELELQVIMRPLGDGEGLIPEGAALKATLRFGEELDPAIQTLATLGPEPLERTRQEGETTVHFTGSDAAGKDSAVYSHRFTNELPFKNTGWKNGVDLRGETDLRGQVVAFYKQLADRIQARDTTYLCNLLVDRQRELTRARYHDDSEEGRLFWAEWLEAADRGYRFVVDEDFVLKLSADGKLVCLWPGMEADMLRVVGKKYANGFTFDLYREQGSDDFKIIR